MTTQQPSSKSPEDARYEKWLAWLDSIQDELVRLNADRRVAREVREMIESNRSIPERGFVYGWIGRQAGLAFTLGVRRLADKRHDVISLTRLVREVRDHPEVMTRARFIEVWNPDDDVMKHQATKTFEKWAGSDGDRVAPESMEKHLEALETAVGQVYEYVNKALAHTAEDANPAPITSEELDTAYDTIGEVHTDMVLLLTCKGLVSPEPTIQTPWRRAFYVAWASQVEIKRHEEKEAWFAEIRAKTVERRARAEEE